MYASENTHILFFTLFFFFNLNHQIPQIFDVANFYVIRSDKNSGMVADVLFKCSFAEWSENVYLLRCVILYGAHI